MSTVLFVRGRRWLAASTLAVIAAWVVAGAAQTPTKTLPLAPPRERGASITPAYEGWYENKDGSFSMLLGYYNRNQKEALDIPVGPNNRVEPGPPDQGQPTHFEIGRQWGVFVIKVPKDFGTKAITWTIVANGETNSIPLTLNKGYPISPFEELGMHNKPPVLAFSEGGPKFTGPPVATAATLTGTVKQPVAIDVWVEDPKSPERDRNPGGGGVPRPHRQGRDRLPAQISRAGHRDVRQAAHSRRHAGRADHRERDVRHARRLPAARAGQRRVGRRRRRLSVLLDQYLRESDRSTVE